MPQLPTHGEIEEEEGGGWIRGTYARDRNVYARRSDGTERKLTTWMPRLGKARLTKDGKDYYSHNRQQFIVNIPTIAYVLALDGTYVMCTVGHIEGGEPVRLIVAWDVTAPDLDQDPEGVKRMLLRQTEEDPDRERREGEGAHGV